MEFGQELSFHLNANAHVGMLPTVGDVAWKNWLHGEHVPNQWGWTRCPALAGCTIAAWITRLQQSITHTVEQAIRPITNIFKIITTILHPLISLHWITLRQWHTTMSFTLWAPLSWCLPGASRPAVPTWSMCLYLPFIDTFTNLVIMCTWCMGFLLWAQSQTECQWEAWTTSEIHQSNLQSICSATRLDTCCFSCCNILRLAWRMGYHFLFLRSPTDQAWTKEKYHPRCALPIIHVTVTVANEF